MGEQLALPENKGSATRLFYAIAIGLLYLCMPAIMQLYPTIQYSHLTFVAIKILNHLYYQPLCLLYLTDFNY